MIIKLNKDFTPKLKYLFFRYIQEILEAFIAYGVYRLLTSKKIFYTKALYMSFIIGLITLILEEYNSSYKDTVKNSIMITIANQLIKK